jgi:hypothetical protein
MNAKHKKVQIATTSQLPPKKFTQEKLQSIMEAASALTSLVQEETGSSSLRSPKREDNITVTPKEQTPSSNADSDESKEEEDEPSKRFIPEHKKPDAALTFPEKVSYFETFGVFSITFISTSGYAELVFCHDKTLILSLLFCLPAHEHDGVCRRQATRELLCRLVA